MPRHDSADAIQFVACMRDVSHTAFERRPSRIFRGCSAQEHRHAVRATRQSLSALTFGMAPAGVLFLLHVWRVDRVFARRARAYGEVVTLLDETTFKLDRANSVINELVQERQERNSFQIAYCYFVDDKPMIALERKRGVRLKVGDTLIVIAPDLGVLGTFEVIDDAPKQCRAISSGPMDALWLGSMKQAGATRSEPPILAVAMRLSVEGDTDDRENTEYKT